MFNAPMTHDGKILPVQATERGIAFSRWLSAVKDLRGSRDPHERALYERTRDQLVRELGLTVNAHGKLARNSIQPGVVHTDTFMSELSVKYANDEYIGDRLMPIVTVGKRSDLFAKYNERDQLAAPDDEVGPEGHVNTVERGRSSDNYSVKDYALKDKISQETLDNQDDVFDEMLDLVLDLTDSTLLKMEKRIAAIVMSTASYAASQTHGAGTKWDDATGGSIVADLLTAVSETWMGSGRTQLVGVCGIAVWNVIANNAAIKGLFQYVREGLATTDAVARYFGMDAILVGRAREDTANIGQAESDARIWATKNFAVLRVAERPTKRSAHFGSTFQHGARKQNQWVDPEPGPGVGVIYNKIGVSQDHKVVADKAGYIVTAVIS